MGHEAVVGPNPWMILPFGVLLAAIALGPLLAATWWGRHYPKVALALGAITLLYYLTGLKATTRVLHVAQDYVSFIALIGSLFVVSGGIHITVKGEATPRANTLFLLVGAVAANLLGTTGASMLLIRPWLRLNKYRLTAHHVVFFIFIVSNVGGCLTPIGDPPLFLGYLKGIPFWWVAQHCWPMWAAGVGLLLAIFYVVDRRNYLRAPPEVRLRLAEPGDTWSFKGLANLVFLVAILGSVFINRPTFVRELIMVGAAVGSYWMTDPQIHQANDFNFHPIREVAILFIGIFATMMPALDWLQLHAGQVGQATPGLFYWSAGVLSSVLDNAPTYLSFLSAAIGLLVTPELAESVRLALAGTAGGSGGMAGADPTTVQLAVGVLTTHFPEAVARAQVTTPQIQIAVLLGNPVYNHFITAVSVGAVFFGAATYIGNGPNFMVKSIADHQKARTPSFLGYIGQFTVPFLLPVLAVVWWVFFR